MSAPAEMCAHRFNAKYVLLLVLISNGLLCAVMPAIVDKVGLVLTIYCFIIRGKVLLKLRTNIVIYREAGWR